MADKTTAQETERTELDNSEWVRTSNPMAKVRPDTFLKPVVVDRETNRIGVGPNISDVENLQSGSTVTVGPQVASLGDELVTNGSFTGNANGWTLAQDWAYGANKATHTPGAGGGTDIIIQSIAIESGKVYRITIDVSGATVFNDGYIKLGNSSRFLLSANETLTTNISYGDGLARVEIGVDAGTFDGSIDNISVKEIIPANAINVLANDGNPGLILNGGTTGGSPGKIYGDDGDIILAPSDNNNEGVGFLNPEDGASIGYINPRYITAERTAYLPDKDGTFAMVSDIGAVSSEEITSGADPVNCDNTKNITYVTSGGTAGDEHVVLPNFAGDIAGGAPSKNGTLHAIVLKIQANGSDVIRVFSGTDDVQQSVRDNFGNVIAKTDTGLGVVLDYVGAAATFIWWDYAWFLQRLDNNDDAVFIEKKTYVPPAGTTGQALVKTGDGDGATGWGTPVEGSDNTPSGIHSHAEGEGTTASGNYAHSEGWSTVASGSGSHAEGQDTVADGWSSQASGYASDTRGGYAAQAYASGRFTDRGDRQHRRMSLAIETTDATPTVLTSDAGAPSATNQMALVDNSAYGFHGWVLGREAATGDVYYRNFGTFATRGAGVATIVIDDWTWFGSGANKTSGASAWNMAVVADTTNGAISIQVTGEVAKTIRWLALIETEELVKAP